MISRFIFSLTLVGFQIFAFGQDYFQQKVDYNIDIIVDDANKEVNGNFEMIYTNHSDQALSYLIMHLWPNAYSSKDSEFAAQREDSGQRDFYFAELNEMGGYRSCGFSYNGRALSFSQYDGQPDIVRLELPFVLKPGDAIHIDGDFQLDVPNGFSRMGKQESAFQLTQWYPKPAVFDADGWHPMPYLDMGEFYSEFGDYTVSVTCPSNYVVAATGQLTTKGELDAYVQMAKDGSAYPAKEGVKTLVYEAKNVHDFGMFLDRDFRIAHETANVPSGRKIDCWGYYHEGGEAWSQSAKYIKRTVEFMSERVGEYPYPQASAVEGLIRAGGGMEYPMVTIIDPMSDAKGLDNVIGHEVIHNWFYGILASNERDNPWMDEGMTSYYESRYMRKHYVEHGISVPVVENLLEDISTEKMIYLLQTRRGMEQPGHCGSREFSAVNYFLAAYGKPTIVMEYLESLYGKKQVDAATNQYFKDWGFKHPCPEDIQASFEKHFDQDLSWLFVDLLQDNKRFDYKIGKIGDDQTVHVHNCGEVPAPYKIVHEGTKEESQLVDGHLDTKVVSFEEELDGRVTIDPDKKSPDAARVNNSKKAGALFTGQPPFDLSFIPKANENSRSLFVYPSMGWNNYDGYMLGLHLANASLLPQKFVFSLTPMYGFKSENLIGNADVHYNWFKREGEIKLVQVGMAYKAYSYLEDQFDLGALQMNKISPYVKVHLRDKANKYVSQMFELRYDQIGVERINSAGRDFVVVEDKLDRYNLNYSWQRDGGVHPQSLNIKSEFGAYDAPGSEAGVTYLRLSLEHNGKWHYSEKKKIRTRVFVGYFPHNDRRDARSVNSIFAQRSFGLAYQGYHDFLDRNFLGRSEQDGILSRQVAMEEGGFKTAMTSPFKNVLGNSNSGIASFNVNFDLPIDVPIINWIKPFLDLGYFSNQIADGDVKLGDQMLWSAGLSVSLFEGAMALHFPIFQSENIDDILNMAGQENVWQRMTFSFNLDKFKPYQWVESGALRVN